jgi:hypothetical protein
MDYFMLGLWGVMLAVFIGSALVELSPVDRDRVRLQISAALFTLASVTLIQKKWRGTP